LQYVPQQRRNCNSPGRSLFPRPLLFMDQHRVSTEI
jgi:hypothetical protein